MTVRRPLGGIAALIAALAVAFVFSAVAQAAPGDLDPSFSGDGVQRTDFGLGGSSHGVVRHFSGAFAWRDARDLLDRSGDPAERSSKIRKVNQREQ